MPRLFSFYSQQGDLFMNKYEGGSFEDFLREEGIFEEVTGSALKRLLILQLGDIVTTFIQRETMCVEQIKSEPMEEA